MKANLRYLIPALASIALTASFALAQAPRNGARPPRTQPTAEQVEARRQQACADAGARQAANFTYVEQRLKLTPAQKPLFDRWKVAEESVQSARLANCGKARPAPAANAARPTLTERNARMEDMLKQRLADLQKTSGPEEALYNGLTDDQKKLFEQRGGRGFAAGGRGGFRMAFAGRGFGGPGFGGGRFFGPGFGPRGQNGPGQFGPGRPGSNAPTPPAPTRG